MKILLLSALLLLNSFLAISQNLIPNSGFDSILLCPALNLVYGDSSRIYKIAPPWFSTLQPNSSPDILNKCSSTRELSVPYNKGQSYQLPKNGDGYAGIWTYTEPITKEGREYLSVPMLKELKRKSQYFVNFYVSPLTSGSLISYSDAIGLTFTDTAFSTQGLEIVTKPSIDNAKGRFIKDTIGWTAISGCYKAKGGERYATIGNFRTNEETSFEFENPLRKGKASYFYVDDVSVYEFNPLPDSTILVCVGETQKYNVAFLNGTYKWNTGSTDSIISISKSGTYSVEVTIEGCVLTDTVVVVVPPDAQNKVEILCLHPDCSGRGDTTLCEGKKIQLSATAVPGQYAWSTGALDSIITVNKTNNYAVTVTNRCGTYNDDVDITLKKCGCNVFVPNAFSPNNDGVNDELQVFFGCDFNYKVKRFQIFNRWGSRIFSAIDTNDIRWDGQVNGKQLPPDVYVWYLEYEYEQDGKMKNVLVSGDFTIML